MAEAYFRVVTAVIGKYCIRGTIQSNHDFKKF